MSTDTPDPTPDNDPDAAELAALRAEVATLRQQVATQETAGEPVAPKAEPKPPSTWWRTALSIVLIVIACALAPLSVVSVWARGEVTNTDRYIATVAPLASNPDVQDAITTRVTDEIFKHIDITGLTQEAIATISANRSLTARQQAVLQALAVPLDSGIKSFTQSTVSKIVDSEAFDTAWTQANYAAHKQIVAALSGQDNGALSVNGDALTLNLAPIIAEVKQKLIDNGFTVAEKIPTVNTQFVLVQSDKIAKLQTAYNALDKLGFWLPIVAGIIALIGVLVAKGRRRAFVGLGVGIFASMALLAIALAIARSAYLNGLPASVNQGAAAALFDAFANFLKDGLRAGAAAGIVLALGGILTGPSKLGVGVRSLADKGASGCQRGLAKVGATMDSVREFVAPKASAFRFVAAILAAVFVLIQRYKTPDLVIWTTVVLLVVLFIIQILASGVDDKDDAQSDEGDAEPDTKSDDLVTSSA